MKRLMFTGCCLSIWAIGPPSFAQSATQTAPQTTIPLYRGEGVTLNFRLTGETIQRAWLDDPSQTTLDFDDARCVIAAEGCAASILHLRRINPINFPGLPTSDVTSLTVVTNNSLYSFRLTFPNSGSPIYSVLNIQPENRNASSSSLQTLPLSPTAPQLTSSESLEAIEQGLSVAINRGLLTETDPLWQRTQTFLSLLRDGLSPQTAAQQAGVSQALILRLVEMGAHTQNLAI